MLQDKLCIILLRVSRPDSRITDLIVHTKLENYQDMHHLRYYLY